MYGNPLTFTVSEKKTLKKLVKLFHRPPNELKLCIIKWISWISNVCFLDFGNKLEHDGCLGSLSCRREHQSSPTSTAGSTINTFPGWVGQNTQRVRGSNKQEPNSWLKKLLTEDVWGEGGPAVCSPSAGGHQFSLIHQGDKKPQNDPEFFSRRQRATGLWADKKNNYH